MERGRRPQKKNLEGQELSSLTFLLFPLKFPDCGHPFIRNKECDKTGKPLSNTHLNDFLNNATVASSILIDNQYLRKDLRS